MYLIYLRKTSLQVIAAWCSECLIYQCPSCLHFCQFLTAQFVSICPSLMSDSEFVDCITEINTTHHDVCLHLNTLKHAHTC